MAEAMPTKFTPIGAIAAALPSFVVGDATAAVPVPPIGSLPYMKGGEPLFIARGSEIGVLLLHGFTSTPHQFRELSRFLVQQNYTVYSPLIAGHGTTPRELAKTTAEDWIRSVEDSFQFLQHRVRRIFIVGNSFGGNLAFWLAHRFPDAIAGIVSLGTPVWLRLHWFNWLRTYTYGWFMTYHKKAGREYKIDYIDLADQVSYPVIPVKSLREFIRFLRTKTMRLVSQVRTPTLLLQADKDPVVHPRSVQFLHEHLGSDYKKVYWLNGRYHNLPDSDRREEIFRLVKNFIDELTAS